MRMRSLQIVLSTIFLSWLLFSVPACAQRQPDAQTGSRDSLTTVSTEAPSKTITIAEFNCLHLGWNNGKDLRAMAGVIGVYDIVGLTEVMDPETLSEVEKETESLTGADWEHVVSAQKLGRSSYKEYYAFMYRKDRTMYLGGSAKIWNDAGDKFEREPFYASFRSGNFDYTLILMHSDFDNNKEVMRKEAGELAKVFKGIQDADPRENDLILMGDFNLKASDAGWEELKALPTVTHLIPATILTTVSTTGNLSSAYDNMWIQREFTANEFAGQSDAGYLFATVFSTFSNPAIVWREKLSDHIPVFAVFYTDKADDD